MIQTVALAGRSVTVSLRDGQRIVTDGDNLFLRAGEFQVRIGFPEYTSQLTVADLLLLDEPEPTHG